MKIILFKILIITDSNCKGTINYFHYREFNQSLTFLVNKAIGPNSLEKLQKEQKQRIQELQNNYKLKLQNLLELQNKKDFTL